MSRFKSNLYTVERRVWRNHKLCWIQNDDFTLFSGHHKTKIKEEDLPEWYVFGRYYKLWGFLSTKGITDLQYIPNLWINHFLKDDCLLISYGGKIEGIQTALILKSTAALMSEYGATRSSMC